MAFNIIFGDTEFNGDDKKSQMMKDFGSETRE